MSVYEYIIGAILIVSSLLIIFVVLLQEGRQANVGVISGAADSFLDKGAAKTLDMKLAKWTKFIAIAFFVLVLGGMLVTKFLSKEALDAAKKEDASSNITSSTVSDTSAAESDTSATESDASTAENDTSAAE
ncbi:MAG: preprotein translocase subunit SecG [Clostridia bacterium]|nr:preprotein translocase subunit SecG [Clostridia bacterium]